MKFFNFLNSYEHWIKLSDKFPTNNDLLQPICFESNLNAIVGGVEYRGAILYKLYEQGLLIEFDQILIGFKKRPPIFIPVNSINKVELGYYNPFLKSVNVFFEENVIKINSTKNKRHFFVKSIKRLIDS